VTQILILRIFFNLNSTTKVPEVITTSKLARWHC
jgi:hypothetical protein